jgi:predicted kinase
MGRKAKDGIEQDKHGIWWAYHKGQRKTPNRSAEALGIYKEMVADFQRNQIEHNPNYTKLSGIEVIILRGLPASGKTTWARQYIENKPWCKRVCKDDLRQMFGYGEYSAVKEKFICKMEDKLVHELLEDGNCVIVDDTNIGERHIRRIKSLCCTWWRNQIWHIPVNIVDIDTPLEECLRRNALRETPIPVERMLELDYQLRADRGERPWDTPEMLERMREAVCKLEERLTDIKEPVD